jgi:tRNA (cmo5U34)-methyltransferase
MAGLTAGPQVWDPATYEASRRRLVPSYDLMYGTVSELVARSCGPAPRVLDLGCGTGLLSAHVLQRVPGARLTLLDGDPRMLEHAVEQCGSAVDASVTGDLADRLPEGPFDAVVSALAVHHLSDDGKRQLMRNAFGALAPGGMFVNFEQVSGSDPRADSWFRDRHEAQARSAGSDDAEWSAALGRMEHDLCSPLQAQMEWLRGSGFRFVENFARDWRFAVYAGWRPLA